MQIRQLTIRRYRGIEELAWKPNPGLNCLIGPADGGKSTVLSAISLLLAPYPLGACSEFDFHRRRFADGFEIEAHIGALDLAAIGAEQRVPIFCGWANGEPAPLPEGEAEPVLRCRVRGTADLELVYDLPTPGLDPPPPFPPALRRRLLLGRLAGEDRATRDLRLGTGSLLDRHLTTSDMRAPVLNAVAQASRALDVPEPAHAALGAIQRIFREAGLPVDLHLTLMPPQGSSPVGMVALASGPDAGEAIPIAYAGTGTRQLALLSLSAALVGSSPILVIDEPERGLEPYRQRGIIGKVAELTGAAGQAFLTTHSPAVLGEVPVPGVWRMHAGQEPLRFEGEPFQTLLQSDPEAFLASAPVLCEGATEMGLLDVWLPRLIGRDPYSYGVRLVDGRGQPNVLTIAERFVEAQIQVGLFVDDEANFIGRRENLRPICAAFIWEGARSPEAAVCQWVPVPELSALIEAAAEAAGLSARYFEDHVYEQIPDADRRGTARDLRTAGYPEPILRSALLAAMTQRGWFKRRRGGQALARMLDRIGVPWEIRRQLDAFGVRLRAVMGWNAAGGGAPGAPVA